MKTILILFPHEVLNFSNNRFLRFKELLTEMHSECHHGLNNQRGDYGVTIEQTLSDAQIRIITIFLEGLSAETPITISTIEREFFFENYVGTLFCSADIELEMHNLQAYVEGHIDEVLRDKSPEFKYGACRKIANLWKTQLDVWLERKHRQYIKK